MNNMDSAIIVDKVFRLYEEVGETGYLGEAISKTSHSIQCAMLAEKEGYPDEIVLAAFLHDVGHLIGEDQKLESMVTDDVHLGAKDHDIVGGKFLRNLDFPENVCHLVQNHVQAKRYLVWKDKNYHSNLSQASKMTLEHQGGPMTQEEAKKFESDPLFETILKMRTWDEKGKDTEISLPKLDKYRTLCRKVLTNHSKTR